MSEYIEKEAVINFIENGLNNPDKTKSFGHDAIEIMAEVQYMPAADVVEVVRGRWIKRQFADESTAFGYSCSECHLTYEVDTNYCPNCGARMDGKVCDDK